MENKDRLIQFLKKHDNQPYCDDCLCELAEVRRRQQVNSICNRETTVFARIENSPCHNCGKIKITRRLR